MERGGGRGRGRRKKEAEEHTYIIEMNRKGMNT